ncbi:hypothetical protein N7495_006046 [Penicillium taxi]|uniref:uncharacterized protein n=1 Tax=Penicillium taxi TaxID=168475 RepID=UPI002544FDF6|nr:uncharacterized protein N7495_006046 [Penicillium taxi]KAJ5894355.1 hypothetical protein N7495_006046 [Penicillium taxi]
MSGVELGLAIFATFDQCFKSIWGILDEEHQNLQENLLKLLENKLRDASLQISKIEKHGAQNYHAAMRKRKAAKYALLVKDSLDKAISELEKWEKKFDPTWYLIRRMAERIIDTESDRHPGIDRLSVEKQVQNTLQSKQETSVFISQSKLESVTRSQIPFSDSQVVDTGKAKFILDSADCTSMGDVSMFIKHVRHLALKLGPVEDRKFHVLKCEGVFRIKDLRTKQLMSCDFLFRFPKGCSEPQSLRFHLISQVPYSLNERIELAKQLATSVSYIHVLDIVHKDIRPENTLIFRENGRESHLGPLFLLGFRAFRMADSKTQRLGSSVWVENIYRHPDRQGAHPGADYAMQHDIYSLGVCLLEIGLWESFVDIKGNALTRLASENPDLSALIGNESLKDYYVALAKDQLSIRMGERYAQVVFNCLTCLDETNEDFGDQTEFEDSDGILIGVKYIEKVCLREF